jgi:hypothetical protein
MQGKVFGTDSRIAKYETKNFEAWVKKTNTPGYQFDYMLVGDINEMLKWAGVPAVADEVIMG